MDRITRGRERSSGRGNGGGIEGKRIVRAVPCRSYVWLCLAHSTLWLRRLAPRLFMPLSRHASGSEEKDLLSESEAGPSDLVTRPQEVDEDDLLEDIPVSFENDMVDSSCHSRTSSPDLLASPGRGGMSPDLLASPGRGGVSPEGLATDGVGMGSASSEVMSLASSDCEGKHVGEEHLEDLCSGKEEEEEEEDEEDEEDEEEEYMTMSLESASLSWLVGLRPFQWATGLLSCLGNFIPLHLLKQSFLVQGATFTTHFSGVGTAERAVQCLVAAAGPAIGFAPALQCLSACECAPASQQMLEQVLSSTACLFHDILDISPAAKAFFSQHEQSMAKLDFHTIWEKVKAAGAHMARRRCKVHRGTFCTVSHTPVLDISGSPCQPWSTAGRRRGQHSHLMILFMCWVLWVRAVRPLLCIHENVPGFDKGLILRLLGDLYDLLTLYTRPADCGFPFIKRRRCYMVLLLKGKVVILAPLRSIYARVAQALVAACPQHGGFAAACPRADPEYCLKWENALRKKRKMSPARSCSENWTYLLTAPQAEYLREYSQAWRATTGSEPSSCASCLFDLSQNPATGRGRTSGAEGAVPTLTRGCSRLWVPAWQRWLLPFELAFLQGYPVTGSAAEDARVAVDPHGVAYSFAQLGSSMHLGNVGCVTGVVLACTRPA